MGAVTAAPYYKHKKQSMKPIGTWNKISPELQKLIPKLEKGKVVTFKMLNGVKNNDPDPIERQRNPFFYPKSNIVLKDRIYDKFANNGEGDWVDIIVADGWEKNEPTKMHIFFPYEHGTVFSGKFSLVGGNAKQEEIYEHIMLCNLNRDAVTGEHRDNTVNPLFGLVSVAGDRVISSNKRDTLLKALELSKNIKIEEARELAASLNWTVYKDDDALMTRVEDFAREKPDEFLKSYSDPTREFKSFIKEALNNQVATYDPQTGIFKVGESAITTLPTVDRKNHIEALGTWFAESPNGKAVLENIKKQLIDKKELQPA